VAVLVWLLLPVEMIEWKLEICLCVDGDVKPCSLTQ